LSSASELGGEDWSLPNW